MRCLPRYVHFAIALTLAYVAASWAVRFDWGRNRQIASLVYPLDTFSMYAASSGPRTSLMMLRDSDSASHRIEHFSAFDCRPSAHTCDSSAAIAYHDRDNHGFIARHAAKRDNQRPWQRMDLVIRSWAVRPWQRPATLPDCVVAHCDVLP